MADESAADDEALYDVWRRLTPDEVAALFDRLELLARAVRRLLGAPPPPALVDEARALRDSGLHLGFLPLVAAVAGP